MSKIAIVAAMERELAPLVRGWKRGMVSSGDKKFIFFERDGVLCGGCGYRVQERGAGGAGRDGAISPDASGIRRTGGRADTQPESGSVFTPSLVVDAADGAEYRCVADGNHVGGGVLVTRRNCRSGSQAGIGSAVSCGW